MQLAKLRGLLPHEFFFGLLLAVTGLRLAVVLGPGSSPALVYLALSASMVGTGWFCRRWDTARLWRLGLLFYPVAMNILYAYMKTAIPRLQPLRFDGALQHIDALLIGGNLSLRLEPLVQPAVTEFLSFCYILFFPYLLFCMIRYFLGDLTVLKKFVIGLFTIYGIGFLGYSLVPAAGPGLAMADRFTVPLTGWWFTAWNAAVVEHGSNGVDVFPSLHCAVSSFLLFFDRRHKPWRFKLYLVPCVGLWISTIYLRYHYFIDVICGFALAALALWLAQRFPKTSHEEIK